MKNYRQDSPYQSPWTLSYRVKLLAWEYVWALMCGWTPKPFNRWRIFWLKRFGARIHGRPFVHQRARIQVPWRLTMHDHACLGDRANAYTLGEIELFEHCTIAQEAYLCAGTHDFSQPARPLQTAKISVGAYAFVGARAFVLPGISIGNGALVGACSVVTRDVPPMATVVGNPARTLSSK